MNEKKDTMHKISCMISNEQYEKVRLLAFKSRKSIALIIREAIDKITDK